MYCYLNGEIVHTSEARISAFDEGFLFGYGIYDTLRSYNGIIVNWEIHWQRLFEQLKIVKICIPETPDKLKEIITNLIKLNGETDQRIRITISAGSNKPTILISTEPLKLPTKKQYQNGVNVITVKSFRNLAHIKSTNMIEQKISANYDNYFDQIYLNNKNQILEGSKTNIIIYKNQKLITPPQNETILAGTTLKLLQKFHLIIEQSIKLNDIEHCDEIFLTNSVIGIIRVNKIDNTTLTKNIKYEELRQSYEQYLTKSYG